MGVRTFARIKHPIWDQLLASKAEIIHSLAVFSFCVQNRTFCNLECLHFFCSLSKGIFNALKRYYVWPWNTLTVKNARSCIVGQKQWWNFLGKKN